MDASSAAINNSSKTSSSSNDMRSKRASFISTYHQNQQWPLPNNLIYYIAKNPSSSKIYDKLIQSCKYFFIKNPILIDSNCFIINETVYKNVYSKIWVSNRLTILSNNYPSYNVSSVIPKFYQCDAKNITLWEVTIFFNDFHFLVSKCKSIWLYQVTVIHHQNEVLVDFEKIVESVPKVQSFETNGPNSFNSKTVSKLLKLPHFLNLRFFQLSDIPEIFDIELFYDYIKKNMKTNFHLDFCDEISDAYSTRLQAIVNEIIETKNHDYKIPFITFHGIDNISSIQLHKLYNL